MQPILLSKMDVLLLNRICVEKSTFVAYINAKKYFYRTEVYYYFIIYFIMPNNVQSIIDKVDGFLCTNKLSINLTDTNFMVFIKNNN